MSREAFFRFPICFFAYGETPAETVESILDWCIWDVGAKAATIEQIDNAEARKLAKAWPCRYTCAEAMRMARGGKVLRLSGGNLEQMIRNARKADGWDRAGSPFVTITGDIMWRVYHTAKGSLDKLDGPEFPWDQFRLFAAVLSKIGVKKFAPCGWQEIQARAAGFAGKTAMRNAGAAVQPELIISHKRIRNILDKLEAVGLLARFHYSKGPRGGKTVFAMGIPIAEAREQFLKQRTAQAVIRERRNADLAACVAEGQSAGKPWANNNRESDQNSGNRQTIIGGPKNGQTPGDDAANPGANCRANPGAIINERSFLTKEGSNERSSLTKEALSSHAQARAGAQETAEETGYLYRGQFIPQAEINAFIVAHKDEAEAISQATPCRRVNGEILQ
jgi:hypothetical protein